MGLSENYQASKDADGYWVAPAAARLTNTQRLENKIKRKLARGDTLAGPFAASPAGIAQAEKVRSEQEKRIAALEKQVNELLAAKGVIPPTA